MTDPRAVAGFDAAAFEGRLAPYAVDGGLEVPTSIQVTAARR